MEAVAEWFPPPSEGSTPHLMRGYNLPKGIDHDYEHSYDSDQYQCTAVRCQEARRVSPHPAHRNLSARRGVCANPAGKNCARGTFRSGTALLRFRLNICDSYRVLSGGDDALAGVPAIRSGNNAHHGCHYSDSWRSACFGLDPGSGGIGSISILVCHALAQIAFWAKADCFSSYRLCGA